MTYTLPKVSQFELVKQVPLIYRRCLRPTRYLNSNAQDHSRLFLSIPSS